MTDATRDAVTTGGLTYVTKQHLSMAEVLGAVTNAQAAQQQAFEGEAAQMEAQRIMSGITIDRDTQVVAKAHVQANMGLPGNQMFISGDWYNNLAPTCGSSMGRNTTNQNQSSPPESEAFDRYRKTATQRIDQDRDMISGLNNAVAHRDCRIKAQAEVIARLEAENAMLRANPPLAVANGKTYRWDAVACQWFENSQDQMAAGVRKNMNQHISEVMQNDPFWFEKVETPSPATTCQGFGAPDPAPAALASAPASKPPMPATALSGRRVNIGLFTP